MKTIVFKLNYDHIEFYLSFPLITALYLRKRNQARNVKLYVFKWANTGLFLFIFCPFLITISIIQIEKSVDGVLGIRTEAG